MSHTLPVAYSRMDFFVFQVFYFRLVVFLYIMYISLAEEVAEHTDRKISKTL